MSYLDTPRLTFSGQFTANPSTINNTATNYNIVQPLGSLAWNPEGRHNFSLNDCKVTGIVTDTGAATSGDPIIGALLASTGPAVLVDLDTYQQGVSQIFGMTVAISHGGATITGKMTPVNFFDMFVRTSPGVPGDGRFSAWYQSVLTDVEWKGTWSSPFVAALKKASGKTLSIHFIVDGYYDDGYLKGHFTTGRVTGTIGPYSSDEPTSFINARLLRPTGAKSKWGSFNFAPAKTDLKRKKIVFDFGNAVPSTWPKGKLFPVFAVNGLTAAILPKSGKRIILGAIDTSDAAYATTAFVQEFDLDDAALTALASSPTAILDGTAAKAAVLAQENATGAYANFDQYVWRLNPGDTGEVTLWANIFEKPAAKVSIPLAMYLDQIGGSGPPVGVPADAIQFPGSVTTKADGTATFKIKAKNPNNPRVYLDGQVYGIAQQWSKDTNPDPTAFVSVHVFDELPVSKAPTWWTDVQPILNQYAVLYPAMRHIIQINDYNAVVANLKPILERLQLPETDPQLMPITRELSRSKLEIILKWAKNGHPEGTA
jgi:hypothetical protein